jgi:hypothetical protein
MPPASPELVALIEHGHAHHPGAPAHDHFALPSALHARRVAPAAGLDGPGSMATERALASVAPIVAAGEISPAVPPPRVERPLSLARLRTLRI